MKRVALLIVLIVLAVPHAGAAGVRLQRLEDFDRDVHKLGVSIIVSARGGCSGFTAYLEQGIDGLLNMFGFQTAPYEGSDLEFAVFVKVFESPELQACRVRLSSVVRKVPVIERIRDQVRAEELKHLLWSATKIESVTLAKPGAEVKNFLRTRAREDVVEFSRYFASLQKNQQ